ncbi:MAG: PP2C family protein-serine/threonine phosphatase [Oscillospiraceae bacterium]|nr:PP2C family protein-serine/threonine phosphatase [Oscillospiraceae bacterium]
MTEKAALFKRETDFSHWGVFLKENAVWAVLGLGAELGSSGLSAAPTAAALVAGLSGKRSLCAAFGGALGAVLHGFPSALLGLAAMGIVLAARFIPDLNNTKLRAAERFFAAAFAVFFARIAEVGDTSELLITIVAALVSGLLALCICLLCDISRTRDPDISEPRDCSLCCIVTALGFLSLGALDYPFANIGRLILGFVLLTVTARRGLAWCAAIAVPAVLGFCANGTAVGAAVIAFSAVASGAFTKYGKIVRAVGFMFFCAVSTVVLGIDDNSWKILVEAAVAAAAFVCIPIEKIKVPESDFSDNTVALMLRERLNFAADAIGGIGSGINAAADTLDRKYSTNPEKIAERAADRACRSCPNSMVCWGKKYEQFRKEFSRLVTQLRTGFELTEFSMSPECAEECVNKNSVIRAISSEYSRYVSAAADERRIRELRRIYIDQLEGVRDILRDMGALRAEVKTANRARTAEKRAEKLLRENGVELPQAFVMFDRRGKLRFEAYGTTEPRVTREYLGTLLIKALGRDLELPEITGSSGRIRITTNERTALSAKIGAFQLPKGQNNVCGDCYDTFTDASGALYVILSDGMGTGSRARVDSAMACSVLSKLLKGGISLPAALETVNNVLMIKSADESFATLDICRLDLNSGECAVYKAGAATTYIKSSDKLVRATLSSPPAGLGGKLTVPAQKFTVGAGDVIVMTTDGAVLDEQWLSRELSQRIEPCELSERIAKAARSAENGRDDDISVIAVAVGN